MTLHNCRTNCRRLSQMRNFATVPLKREPLTQRSVAEALDCRRTVAAASVGMLRFGYAPNGRLAAPGTSQAEWGSSRAFRGWEGV